MVFIRLQISDDHLKFFMCFKWQFCEVEEKVGVNGGWLTKCAPNSANLQSSVFFASLVLEMMQVSLGLLITDYLHQSDISSTTWYN